VCVCLQGTPVQNNLEELFAVANFVNPGILGELATFKRVFQGPVESGCDAKATPAVKQLARDRALELAAVAAKVRQRAAWMPCLTTHSACVCASI
jgi:DNA repair and recombination RAD54-like protein